MLYLKNLIILAHLSRKLFNSVITFFSFLTFSIIKVYWNSFVNKEMSASIRDPKKIESTWSRALRRNTMISNYFRIGYWYIPRKYLVSVKIIWKLSLYNMAREAIPFFLTMISDILKGYTCDWSVRILCIMYRSSNTIL